MQYKIPNHQRSFLAPSVNVTLKKHNFLGRFRLHCMNIAKFFYQLFYRVCHCLPVKHQVIFLSRQSNVPSIDFIKLAEQLKQQSPNIKILFQCKKIPSNMKGKWGYAFYLLSCLPPLAMSQICVVDTYSIPVSVLHHRKQLCIMQIWHALCGVKQFGHQTIGKNAGNSHAIATIMQMHQNYTHVLAPSPAVASHFAQAFQVSKQRIHCLGLPRMDYILTPHPEQHAKLFEAYPQLLKKQNILYTPTFRKHQPTHFSSLIRHLDRGNYNLVVKHHEMDLAKQLSCEPLPEQVVIISESFSLFDLYQVCDLMITDYSSSALEFSLLNKPIYFYVYDYEEYKKDPGLNIDPYDHFPLYTFQDAKWLMHTVQHTSYDLSVVNCFKSRYLTAPTDGSCAQQIATLLLSHSILS